MSFDEFWATYANVRVYKSKGSKAVARQIYNGEVLTKPHNGREGPDSIRIESWMHPYLMKAVDALNERLQAEDQQWYNAPAVSVWLNQHRWEEYGVELPEKPQLRVVGE